MVAIKAHQVEDWLARPQSRQRLVLVYGPDRGLVRERAARVASGSSVPLDDPFATIRLEADDLEAAPGRLTDEVRTLPMFSSRRLIWVRGAASQRKLADELKHISGELTEDVLLLIEAGDLKKSAAIRTLAEADPAAVALPCFSDDGRALGGLIDETLAASGLSIAPDARQLLTRSLGGDRLATRGELEKLSLYCAGAQRIEVEDVRAAIGDVSAQSADELVDALLAGRARELDRAFSQWVSSGSPAFLVVNAALRQFQSLHRLRHEFDAGKPAAQVIAAARPPVFFSRRKTMESVLALWSRPMIERGLERLQGVVLATRKRPALELSATRQALLGLTLDAARAARAR